MGDARWRASASRGRGTAAALQQPRLPAKPAARLTVGWGSRRLASAWTPIARRRGAAASARRITPSSWRRRSRRAPAPQAHCLLQPESCDPAAPHQWIRASNCLNSCGKMPGAPVVQVPQATSLGTCLSDTHALLELHTICCCKPAHRLLSVGTAVDGDPSANACQCLLCIRRWKLN